MSSARILVTGAAGFIGAHVCSRLSALGFDVVGCDNYNDYYDPALKHARVAAMLTPGGVRCDTLDLADGPMLRQLFERHHPTRVVHLAAQAGVRHSIAHPEEYVRSNLVGFANVLEAARLEGVEHLVYASSSSVYGRCLETPFFEAQRTDEPVSLYAATKKANEAMAFAYSSIHAMRCTGLRFFTVYGPWGRPDMAYFSFAERLRAGAALPVFADGMLQRDFTYIDDIVEGVVRLTLSARRSEDPPHEIFNIGNHRPVRVIDFIEALSGLLGVTPKLEFLPMQPGDVPITCANVDKLRARVGFEPATPLGDGLAKFVQWFDGWRKRSDGRTGV